jgi:hypothetical protein
VPPSIPKKTIKKLSASLCNIEASQVTDVVLNKKGAAPVGIVPPKEDNKEAGEVEDRRQTHRWEEALEDC